MTSLLKSLLPPHFSVETFCCHFLITFLLKSLFSVTFWSLSFWNLYFLIIPIEISTFWSLSYWNLYFLLLSKHFPLLSTFLSHFQPACPLQTFTFSAFSYPFFMRALSYTNLTLLLTQHPPSTHHSNASSQLQLLPLIRLRHQTFLSSPNLPSLCVFPTCISSPNLHSLSLRFPTLLFTRALSCTYLTRLPTQHPTIPMRLANCNCSP